MSQLGALGAVARCLLVCKAFEMHVCTPLSLHFRRVRQTTLDAKASSVSNAEAMTRITMHSSLRLLVTMYLCLSLLSDAPWPDFDGCLQTAIVQIQIQVTLV